MKTLSGLTLIYKMVITVFPAVDSYLKKWKIKASLAGDDVLRTQALSSIEKKKFHCQGGSAYALYPDAAANATVRFIIAFQTISDYLDNLCDRAGILDEAAFRQLHLALLDAVSLETACNDYYLLYPYKNDNGYLAALVEECRLQASKLPAYSLVKGKLRHLVLLYSDLQAIKHIAPDLREKRLRQWAGPLAAQHPGGITVWEYCAATGSTLGVFVLFAAAQNPALTEKEANALFTVYFPWICGLHILLDYYIDAAEDRAEGDFNFTSYYKDTKECGQRLSLFIRESAQKCKGLKFPKFHKTVLCGLLALYLSDPKACAANQAISRKILKSGGKRATLYYSICVLLRHMGKI